VSRTDGVPRGAIDHLDLSVRDPAASAPFYEAVLGYMGFEAVRLVHGNDHLPIFQSTDAGQRYFSIALQPAKHPGEHDRYVPGLHHVAFGAASRADVDGLYRLLCDLGAEVLDPPAEYPEYAPEYYAVFFRDPDGLKLEFVYMPSPPEVAPVNS
jgi:catechol 2,3-dioxygenase-like lactoylglutathione lyase family enzyme